MLLILHQQAADELGGDNLSGAGEEGVGEGLGERGGYGSGFCEGVQRSVFGFWWMGDNGAFTPHSQAMSEEQLKAFMEAVKADSGLQEQLKAAGDPDAVVEIAKAAGFAIFADELQQAQAEISEEELAGLIGAGNQHNGGGFTVNINNGIGSYASFLCF